MPGGGRDSVAGVNSFSRIEERGLSAGWATSGSGLDAVSLCAVAAVKTERILLGTAITHMWSMAPVKMAQQGQVAAQLSGGRFRLGIGVAGQPAAEGMYGATYSAPLGHLREYVSIVKSLVDTGQVDFKGKYYRATAKLPGTPVPMPVMISALRAGAFKVAGEVADGAITWVTPGSYVRDIAGPALREAAKQAGREAPKIVLHVPVTVHENIDEVRAQARQQFGFYVKAPHYQNMFIAAGFKEAASGDWSDAMIDAVIVSGNEATVEARLKELESFGIAEFIASPLNGLSEDRTFNLLKSLAD